MPNINHDQEREVQRREGAKMSDEPRSTLHVRAGYAGDRQRGKFGDKRKSGGARQSAKGHDAKLKGWQADAKQVVVSMIAYDAPHRGVLVESDRYTITLKVTQESGTQELLLYKHAICSIALESVQ